MQKRGLIKRVIGLPGETIEFKGDDCTLYVNNVEVTQDFIPHAVQKQTGRNLNYGYSLNTPITLGDDSYFVLGDNRANSFDSLHGLGLVKKDEIVGKAVLRVWPISKIGSLKKSNKVCKK